MNIEIKEFYIKTLSAYYANYRDSHIWYDINFMEDWVEDCVSKQKVNKTKFS